MKIALCELGVRENLEELLAFFARDTIVETCDRASLAATVSPAPDVVIVPSSASQGNGIAIVAELRRNPAFARSDIWFAAAISDHAINVSALESGASELLILPIDLLELISRIRVRLKISSLQTQYEDASDDAEFLRRGIANAPGLVTLVEAKRKYIVVSDTFGRLYGKHSSEIIGRKPEEVMHSADGAIRQTFERELLDGGLIQPPKIEEVADGDGSFHRFLVARAPIQSADGSIIGLTACGIPASSIHGEAQRSDIDRLTGLPTADAFEDLLAEMSERAAQFGQRVVICRMTIRNLHELNDTLGRAVGDRLLLGLAQRLNVLAMDFPGATNRIMRHSGDGFTLLALGQREKAAIAADVQAWLDGMRRPLLIAGNAVEAKIEAQSFSIDPSYQAHLVPGVIRAGSKTESDLIEIESPPLSPGVHAADENPSATFARALKQDELFLDYQAQIDLAAGSIAGVEALLRWRCPGGKILQADRILEIARKAKTMSSLTNWVLLQAEKDAPLLGSAGASGLRLCVNADLQQMLNPAIQQAFMQTKLSIDRVGVVLNVELAMRELTLAAPETVRSALLPLSDAGIEITIDMGSAISAEALQRFGNYASKIKIAMTSAAQVTGLSALTQKGIKVVASNIENAEQLVAAREARVTEAQGFFVHQPTSPQELVVSIRQGML